MFVAVQKQGNCHSEGAKRLKNPLFWSERWMLRFAQHDNADFWDSLKLSLTHLPKESIPFKSDEPALTFCFQSSIPQSDRPAESRQGPAF
jgi:hypothetical protein